MKVCSLNSGLLGDRHELRDRLLDRPLGLLLKQRLDQRIEFVLVGAARQHRGAGGQRIEREFAEDEAHLAGVDVALLQFRIGGLVEVRAVRAGHRGVFDDGDRSVVLAERAVAERRRDQKLGRGHALRRPRAAMFRCRAMATTIAIALAPTSNFRRVIT